MPSEKMGWVEKLDPREACIEGQRDTKRVENDAWKKKKKKKRRRKKGKVIG